jgi:hypothetical protein
MSGSENEDGFDVGISPDIAASIHGTLEGCGQLDDKCYHEVQDVLQSAKVEMNHKLEGRDFLWFIKKNAKLPIVLFANIINTLRISWYQKSHNSQDVESFMFIPLSKISEATKLQSAAEVVVSAAGSAVATIRPRPDPTSIEACVVPITPCNTS